MSRCRNILVAGVIALLLSEAKVEAYDAENTHRWITRQAVTLLVETYPEYAEAMEHIEDLVEGAFHEDDFFLDGDDDPTTLRVMRHFYHASTQSGLTFGGRTFPNSYEWNSKQTEENQWDYQDALLAYQKGDLADAYFIAGHTLHLIGDLTVPAHSHNDDHGPPKGDDYENHCTSRMVSEFEGTLKTPAPGSIIPEFLDLADAFQKTANASYNRNLYPGNLSGDTAEGIVSLMFPEMSRSIVSGLWTISGVGEDGDNFYEEEEGLYYFSNNAVTTEYDVLDFDASSPTSGQYGPINSDKFMVERMADDLVPIAILHTASVLKLFMDEARALPKITGPGPGNNVPDDANCGCSSSSSGQIPWFSLLVLVLFFRRKQSRN